MLQQINNLLDVLFFNIISPVFSGLGKLLEIIVLQPLQLMQLPPALQVIAVAILTALLSLGLRTTLKTEEKENEFKQKFLAKKKQQEELQLITDWKSREKFARAMDDDIDEDFNSYLAGRFARYGIAYLLPIFLVQFWLENATGYTLLITLPQNSSGLSGIPVLPVFLISYILTLFIYFRIIKKKRRQLAAPTAATTAT